MAMGALQFFGLYIYRYKATGIAVERKAGIMPKVQHATANRD
jgi:hypothetical protein